MTTAEWRHDEGHKECAKTKGSQFAYRKRLEDLTSLTECGDTESWGNYQYVVVCAKGKSYVQTKHGG